jgi:hypothetical protein
MAILRVYKYVTLCSVCRGVGILRVRKYVTLIREKFDMYIWRVHTVVTEQMKLGHGLYCGYVKLFQE